MHGAPASSRGRGVSWRRSVGIRVGVGVGVGVGVATVPISAIRYLAAYGNAMPFPVHTLGIAHVVTLLTGRSGSLRSPRSCKRACQQAQARSYSRAASASHSCARRCAQARTYGGTRCPAGYRGPVRRRAACLLVGELPTGVIVVTKLIETSAGTRQNSHAGSRRHACARNQRYCQQWGQAQ